MSHATARFTPAIEHPSEYDPAWLWLNRIPAIGLTLLESRVSPDRSGLPLDLAAMLSAGRVWPDGCSNAPTSVLVGFNTASVDFRDPEPRLRVMGADPADCIIAQIDRHRPLVPQLSVLLDRHPGVRAVVTGPVVPTFHECNAPERLAIARGIAIILLVLSRLPVSPTGSGRLEWGTRQDLDDPRWELFLAKSIASKTKTQQLAFTRNADGTLRWETR